MRPRVHHSSRTARNALVIAARAVQYVANPPSVREREGTMDELIDRLMANVGVDRAAAEKAVFIILDFLRKERHGA